MYSLLRLLAPPRSPSTNSMEPNTPRGGRNWCRVRPRTKSHGDIEGVHSSSLRPVHSYAPYPSPHPVFALQASAGLGHRTSSSRGSRRPYPAFQLSQGGWYPIPPSASSHPGTILGSTDASHQPGSIPTSFTPNVGVQQNPRNFSTAKENGEEWGCHPAWNAGGGELGEFTSFCLSRVYGLLFSSRGSGLLRSLSCGA